MLWRRRLPIFDFFQTASASGDALDLSDHTLLLDIFSLGPPPSYVCNGLFLKKMNFKKRSSTSTRTFHYLCFRRDDVPYFSPRFRATCPPEQVPEGEQESDDETLRRSSDLWRSKISSPPRGAVCFVQVLQVPLLLLWGTGEEGVQAGGHFKDWSLRSADTSRW